MPAAPRKTRPHVLARRRLMAILRRLAATGERQLPCERSLCKELDVGVVTMRRAIKQLASEGRIMCVPRKGNFLGEVPEYHNIGVVIGDGSTVSFFHGAKAIGGVIEGCENGCVYLRTIQLRAPERAPRVLTDYGLDGCIWPVGEASQLDRVTKAVSSSGVPVVVVMLCDYRDPASIELPVVRVEPDYQGIGALRARFLIERGHRAIACFTDPGSEPYKGFSSAVSAAGVQHQPEWAFTKESISERLPRILDQGEATALIVNGGPANMARILQTVDAHPAGSRLELLLDHVGSPMAGLLAQHPRLRIAGINRYPEKELGVAAARMLIDHLQNGHPLSTVRLLSRITPGPLGGGQHV